MPDWPLVSRHFPYVPIRVVLGNQQIDVEALLDTGFDGDVVLPVAAITGRRQSQGRFVGRLADGSRVRAPLYEAVVTIGSVRLSPTAVVAVGDVAMIGRRLIQHFRVTLDHGERVIVEP